MPGAWALANWHTLIGSPWDAPALAAVSAVGGGIIGIEREWKSKPAGLRTMALVSVGAAVFTMISIGLGAPGDRGRIAAQVVTGMGFLGAGAILRGPQGVLGLTTAATIWVTAAVGMVIGSGAAGAGLALSAGAVMILAISDRIERRFLGPCSFQGVTVSFRGDGGKTLVRIEDILDEYRIPHREWRHESADQGLSVLHLHYCKAHRHHKEFLTRLASLPEVEAIARHHSGPID